MRFLTVDPAEMITDRSISAERVGDVAIEIARLLITKLSGPAEAMAATSVAIAMVARLLEVQGWSEEEITQALKIGEQLAGSIEPHAFRMPNDTPS